MKMTTVRCPVCGAVNRDLFLEETDGWFECQECMHSSRVQYEDDTEEGRCTGMVRKVMAGGRCV